MIDFPALKVGLVHECSHAAIVLYLGYELDRLELKNDHNEALDGHCYFWGDTTPAEDVLVDVAGYLGECCFSQQEPTPEGMSKSETSRNDWERVKDYPHLEEAMAVVLDVLKDAWKR